MLITPQTKFSSEVTLYISGKYALAKDISSDKTVTNNSVSMQNATAKFTGGGMSFNGTSAYLQLDDTADFNMTGDYTWEFWLNFSTLPSGGNNIYLWHKRTGSDPEIEIFFSESSGNYNFSMQMRDNAAGLYALTSSNVTIATGEWHHFACVRSGSTWQLYYDGTQVGSATKTSNALYNGTSTLRIGRDNSGLNRYVAGNFDECLITKGRAKYTANFTAPNKRFF